MKWLSRMIFLLVSLGLPAFATAKVKQLDELQDCSPLGLLCPLITNVSSILDIIRGVVNILLVFVSLVAAIVIIYAGIRYIFSGGEEKKAEEAKNTIVYVVIGLIVIGLSAAIVNFILGLVK